MSNLVDSWLNGIGLGYAVPIFAGQGINSPDMLSELDVVDFPELGISDQNDRKKLFYLIQRVKLALARGRAAETKAAPQADSAVSLTGAAEASREAARAKEENGSSAAHTSVRFRRELEVPASRAAASPRAGSASAGSNSASAGGGGGGSGAVERLTPAKVQRLPPSHRRPKTPHADGTVQGKPQQQQQQQQQQQRQPPQSTAGASRTSSAGGGRARQQPPVGRLAAAEESGIAVLAVEHETIIQVFPEEQQDASGGCGGGSAPGTPPERPSSRPKVSTNKPYEQHRSVLEPVQLDEAGGRTRVSSCSTAAADDERRLMPPPPSSRTPHPAQGNCPGQAAPPAVVSRPHSRREGTETAETFSGHAVAALTAVPPQPPRDAQEHRLRGRSVPSRRPSPEGLRDASPRHAAAPPANAVVAPSLPTQEVARLQPLKRDTVFDGGGGSSDRTARSMETPDRDETSAGAVPVAVAGTKEEKLSVPLAIPSLPEVEEGVGEGDDRDVQAAAAGKGRRESAAELAVHLISAHREDVRSALAAARKDMDLVSKADKDRQPAALMEYAREVEGVLGQRIAAGAKLRQALDSYLALRQAAGAGAAAPKPRPEGHGSQGGRLRAGGRALRT